MKKTVILILIVICCIETGFSQSGTQEYKQKISQKQAKQITEGNELLKNEHFGSAIEIWGNLVQQSPQNSNFNSIKDKATGKAGYVHIPSTTVKDAPDFLRTAPTRNVLQTNDDSCDKYPKERPIPTVAEIHQILISKRTIRRRKEVFQNVSASAMDANGSSCSILSWAKAAGLDSLQKRGFEIILASFLLTFLQRGNT